MNLVQTLNPTANLLRHGVRAATAVDGGRVGWGLRVLIVCLCLFSLSACTMQDLPRNMKLKAFNPHREGFTCIHEATNVPPITPEAQALFEEGLAVTRRELVGAQRDYKTAAVLWEKAAAQNHWKAIINLAASYTHARGQGALGLLRDDERAVLLLEKGMQLGIPAAFDLMGTFHMEGRGVNSDSSRAFAFWQLAADMGSPSAQAYLGLATGRRHGQSQCAGIFGYAFDRRLRPTRQFLLGQ